MSSPTLEGLRIANQISTWQNEAKNLDGEMMQKGELTITPQRVYLTCQELWKPQVEHEKSMTYPASDAPASSNSGGGKADMKSINA